MTDTSFPIFDDQKRYIVADDKIFNPASEVIATYFPYIGFITIPKRDNSGQWMLQNKIVWEHGPLTGDRGLGLTMLYVPTEGAIPQGFKTFIDREDYDRFKLNTKKEFYTFFFPDGTVGFRVEFVTAETRDGYRNIGVMIFTAQEFEEYFKAPASQFQFSFKGLVRTFFF